MAERSFEVFHQIEFPSIYLCSVARPATNQSKAGHFPGAIIPMQNWDYTPESPWAESCCCTYIVHSILNRNQNIPTAISMVSYVVPEKYWPLSVNNHAKTSTHGRAIPIASYVVEETKCKTL